MTNESIGFHAMPDSKHLRYTHCGYTELSLRSLSEEITSDQVSKVFINGVEKRWRTMGDNTLMVIPAFKQEAQRVVVELKTTENHVAPVFRPWNHNDYRPPPRPLYRPFAAF